MPQLDAALADPNGDPLLRVDPWTALADGRGQLMRALDGLDQTGASLPLELPEDARGARWLVGDLLTHLAAWDELVAATLRAIAEDTGPVEVTAAPEAEWAAWNADRIAEGRARPLEARLERLESARRELLQAGGAIAPDAFDMATATAWGIDETPRGMLVVQAMHDGMHAEMIAAATGIDSAAGRRTAP
jgi:hypothetical protein